MELTLVNFRAYVYIELNRGQKPSEIFLQLQQAQVGSVPSKATVFRWCQEFSDGSRESLADRPRSGRPPSVYKEENVNIIAQLIAENPRQSLRQLSESVGCSKDSVRRIVEDHLGLRKLCSVWIPHCLSDSNKRDRVECARQLSSIFEQHSMEECLRLWTTEDETWVLFDSFPTKQENKAWLPTSGARPRVHRPKLTNRKSMLLFAFTGDGKCNIETVNPGESVTSERYIAFITATGEKWRTLRSSPTRLKELWWQHDNARPHVAATTKSFLERREVTVIKQSPYSPDLNLCDRWMFKELKQGLRKLNFHDSQEIQMKAFELFRQIPRERFRRQLELLRDHCVSVIRENGDYIV